MWVLLMYVKWFLKCPEYQPVWGQHVGSSRNMTIIVIYKSSNIFGFGALIQR